MNTCKASIFLPLCLTLISENLDVETVLEVLSNIASNDNAETVKKELNNTVVTWKTQLLKARTEDLAKVRLTQCMHWQTAASVTSKI